MKSVRKNAFIVAINALVVCVLLALVAFVPPAIVDFYRLLRWHIVPSADPYSGLPNYANSPWSKKHFQEFATLQSQYYDFIVWRSKAFNGETVHIDDRGYRRHSETDFPSADVWFFGGSVMWGYGDRDSETIPADVQQISGLRTFNFAEPGYVAHQSLELLMKAYLEGAHPKYVVFLDGINDVWYKCLVNRAVYSSFYELPVRKYVEAGTREDNGSQILSVFYPTTQAFELLGTKIQNIFGKGQGTQLDEATSYECQNNPQKIHAIANALVADWIVAKAIVEAHGGQFIPILQPSAYIGTPNLTFLKSVRDNIAQRKQYELVYPEIKKTLAEQHFQYFDFTKSFDGDGLYYIDAGHVSPNGNTVLAKEILTLLH